MNYILPLLIPLLFLLSFGYAIFKKVKVYDSFTEGVKSAIPLVLSVFPYVVAVTMLCKIFEASGLEKRLSEWLSPIFAKAGIPVEITSLVLMKPLSGSGSIAVLTQILERYGVDSFAGRCACVCYASSDTIFYIGAVYFAGLQRKKLPLTLAIVLFSYLFSVFLACALCRIM